MAFIKILVLVARVRSCIHRCEFQLEYGHYCGVKNKKMRY